MDFGDRSWDWRSAFCCAWIKSISVASSELENETAFFVDGRTSGEVICILTAAGGEHQHRDQERESWLRDQIIVTLTSAEGAALGWFTTSSEMFVGDVHDLDAGWPPILSNMPTSAAWAFCSGPRSDVSSQAG